jgi:type VI secretion system secreted protein Hcp
MAYEAYLALKGTKQGQIKGSVTKKGKEGSILVHSFTHEVVAAMDPLSGKPTGKRQHKPVVLTKDIDQSSPALWIALTTNEVISDFTLLLWSVGADQETQYYTIKLTNARIASIVEALPDTDDQAPGEFSPRETLSFIYQTIEWIWTDGGITATDWQSGI